MQFRVPQFLDIEDKIFGPFTFRQFVYLMGGAGLSYIIYSLLGIWIGGIPIIAIIGVSLALAFYRPNGKPFINMLQAGVKYTFQNKLYIWQKEKGEEAKGKAINEASNQIVKERSEQKLTSSKLRDLAWSLDVLDMKK